MGRAESSQGAGPSGRHQSLSYEVTASFRNGHAAARPAQAIAATSAADSRERPAGPALAGGSAVRERLSRDLSRERSGGEQPEAQLYSSREHLRRLRSGQDEGLDAKEALRRSRISAANKGRVPWNKGGSHRPGPLTSCAYACMLSKLCAVHPCTACSACSHNMHAGCCRSSTTSSPPVLHACYRLPCAVQPCTTCSAWGRDMHAVQSKDCVLRIFLHQCRDDREDQGARDGAMTSVLHVPGLRIMSCGFCATAEMIAKIRERVMEP